jgi:hypothetical protein
MRARSLLRLRQRQRSSWPRPSLLRATSISQTGTDPVVTLLLVETTGHVRPGQGRRPRRLHQPLPINASSGTLGFVAASAIKQSRAAGPRTARQPGPRAVWAPRHRGTACRDLAHSGPGVVHASRDAQGRCPTLATEKRGRDMKAVRSLCVRERAPCWSPGKGRSGSACSSKAVSISARSGSRWCMLRPVHAVRIDSLAPAPLGRLPVLEAVV